MPRKQSQQGAVVSVVVIVLLVAALGYVLYQNFSKPKANEQSSQKAAPKPAELNQTAETSITGWTIGLKYPADWTVERSNIKDEFAEVATATISSKDKSMSVEVRMDSFPQLGGGCETGISTVHFLRDAAVSGASSAHFREAIIQHQKGVYSEEGFTFHGSLVDKTATREGVAVGQDGCLLATSLSDHFTKEPDVNHQSGVPRSTVIVHVASLENGDGTTKTVQSEQTIKDALASEDYKTAVRIVQSYSQK